MEVKEENKVTLKEYFESKISSVKESIIVALAALEKRLEGMNEFRDTLRDQTATFVTREELDAKMESLDKGRRDNIALFISLLGLAVAVVSIIIKLR